MNATYSYDTQEASSLITNRIYYLLESKNWSVKTLSDQSNIPYETLKKLLSRKTENTSFHNIMKIALAFKCNLDYLVEPLEHTCDILFSPTSVQTCFRHDLRENECIIPLFDSSNTIDIYSQADTLNISQYPDYIKNVAKFGIAISSYCYHPLYHPDEILLVGQNRFPYSGETCVFLHKRQIYIRTLHKTGYSIILKSINGVGSDIEIHDFSEWMLIGYIAGIHTFEISQTTMDFRAIS